MDYANLDQELSDLIEKFETTKQCLDLKTLSSRLASLLQERESLSFWMNVESAMQTNKDIKELQTLFEQIKSLQKRLENVVDLKKMLGNEIDISSLDEIFNEVLSLKVEINKLHIRTLMDGPHDKNNAIITIHSGAGGTESYDWTEMLYRMYSMYCEKNNYEKTVLDILENGIGIKSVTFLVKGNYAYGKLKSEKGVHRLVRISPYDSQNRRHTTFASVEVLPEIAFSNEIKIRPEDIRIDTFRSSGAGGQNVNKTDSAIRITHLPTNIVVSCQNERSQLQNREMAIKILTSKLLDLKEEAEMEKKKEFSGELKKIEWGSQIRSYVFQPYSMVKDHRTDYETSDVQGIMNGGLDPLIDEYLLKSHS